ncbi:MAG: DUF2232 domain-containing protein [Janthinobacterium lividum]
MFDLPQTREDFFYILGGGALCALLFLGSQFYSPLFLIFSNLVQLPLLCLGLSRGVSSQFYASVVACLFLCLGSTFLGSIFFSLVSLIPAFILTTSALAVHTKREDLGYQHSSGQVLSHLLIYMVGLLIFFMILFQFKSKGELSYDIFIKDRLIDMAPDNLKLQYQQGAEILVRVLPFVFCGAALLTTLLNFFLAQTILVKNSKNLRSTPLMSDIRLPWWLWIALAIYGLLIFVLPDPGSQFFLNASLILCFGFLFEGLSVVHTIHQHFGYRRMFLWLFYFVMVLFVWLIFFVIGLGVFQPWIKLRERLGSVKES